MTQTETPTSTVGPKSTTNQSQNFTTGGSDGSLFQTSFLRSPLMGWKYVLLFLTQVTGAASQRDKQMWRKDNDQSFIHGGFKMSKHCG